MSRFALLAAMTNTPHNCVSNIFRKFYNFRFVRRSATSMPQDQVCFQTRRSDLTKATCRRCIVCVCSESTRAGCGYPHLRGGRGVKNSLCGSLAMIVKWHEQKDFTPWFYRFFKDFPRFWDEPLNKLPPAMKHIVRVSGLQTHSDWCRFGTETVPGGGRIGKVCVEGVGRERTKNFNPRRTLVCVQYGSVSS